MITSFICLLISTYQNDANKRWIRKLKIAHLLLSKLSLWFRLIPLFEKMRTHCWINKTGHRLNYPPSWNGNLLYKGKFGRYVRTYGQNIRQTGVIYGLCLTQIMMPYKGGFADDMQQMGALGQSFGAELLEAFSLPEMHKQDNLAESFSFPVGQEQMNIHVTDVFPESAKLIDPNTQMEVYGNDAKLLSLGIEHQQQLDNTDSSTSSAYQLLHQIDTRSRPNLTQDPLWSLSDVIFADPNLLSQTFTDCDVDLNASDGPNFVQCDRYPIMHKQCQIHHRYQAGLIDFVAGPLNIKGCGEGCLTLWIGEIGDNYWEGNCTIFEREMQVNILNPEAIVSATLEYAKWDDYMQVWIGEEKVWSGPDGNFPPETLGNCELKTDLEINPNVDVTHYFKQKRAEPLTIKNRVSVTGLGEGYARIKLEYDPSKVLLVDEWYPQSCLNTANFIPQAFEQYQITCQDMPAYTNQCTIVNGIEVCEKQFAPSPIEGISPLCRLVSVEAKEESYLGDNIALCQTLENRSECGFYSSSCVKMDGNGTCLHHRDTYDCQIKKSNPNCVVSSLFPSAFEECRTTEHSVPFIEYKHLPDIQICEQMLNSVDGVHSIYFDGCQSQLNNPKCELIRKTCMDQSSSEDLKSDKVFSPSNEICRGWHYEYDCGTNIEVSNLAKETRYHCDGPIRCMGHDCIEPASVTEANFTEALAKLNLAQDMASDLSCAPIDGSSQVSCQLFKGEAATCKKAIGGIVNCCDTPSGISLGEYISLLSAIHRLDTVMNAMDPSSALYGSWQQLSHPITESWSLIKQPFASTWDALLGTTPINSNGLGAEQAASQFLQSLTNQTATWVGQTFGAGAQSALFTNVGGSIGADGLMAGGQFSLGGIAGTTLSGVMTAYTIYSVTLLLIKMIWECEQSEFELGVKRELKTCHAVGAYCHQSVLGQCTEKREAYCCFASPLGRIFQQQARMQLGNDFGLPSAPSCEGLAVELLDNLDWSKMDLDEWIAILGSTGHLNELNRINIESLTGQQMGSELDPKETIIDRLEQRLLPSSSP